MNNYNDLVEFKKRFHKWRDDINEIHKNFVKINNLN